MKIKILDVAIIIIVLTITAGISFTVYGSRLSQVYAHIKSPGEELFYPLDTPRLIQVKGPLGITEMEIDGGYIRVLSSPCAEKVCVKSGKIQKGGEWIACLPNQVLITIEGRQEENIDAESY
jgi:hypothetical protein